jgi:hypothetical protein
VIGLSGIRGVRRRYHDILLSQKRFTELNRDDMAEWAISFKTPGSCWMKCPACHAQSRFDSMELAQSYADEGDAIRPYMKCGYCDFQPYLPLELERVTMVPVVMLQSGPTAWAPVEESTTNVRVEKHVVPREFRWRSLRRD